MNILTLISAKIILICGVGSSDLTSLAIFNVLFVSLLSFFNGLIQAKKRRYDFKFKQFNSKRKIEKKESKNYVYKNITGLLSI